MEEILIPGLGGSRRRGAPRLRVRSIGTKPSSLPLTSLSGRARGGSSKEWEELPSFHDQNSLREWWSRQQKRRQSQVEAESPGTDHIEPPFPLDVLTVLALENPDFYSVVDQLATDVAGLGWYIQDKKEIAESTPGAEGIPEVDQAAGDQRKAATDFLEEAPSDFDDLPMDLEKLFKCAVFDRKSTGNGYVEISSTADREVTALPDGSEAEVWTNVRPAGLFHVPSRLVRRLKDGKGWKQIDDQGKNIAVFRDFGSDPNDPSSVVSPEEAQKYSRAIAGELKNELKALKDYHSAEAHYGIPAAIAGLRSIMGTIYAENRNLRFFINRGLPDWLIEVKADNDDLAEDSDVRTVIDENIDIIEAHMKYLLEGEDHRALINEIPRDRVEFVWSRLTQPVEDQDFPTYRIDNRDTTIRVYRVPPSRLSIMEAANLGSGSGQNQAETYKTSIVDPEQRELERFVNQLLERLGLALVEFKFVEMDVVDELRQAQIFQIYWTSGIMSVNEGRRFASRYLKDIELPDEDDDLADTPVKLFELQTGGGQPSFGLGLNAPGAAGSNQDLAAVLNQRFAPRQFRVDPTYRNVHRALRSALLKDAGGPNGGQQGTGVKGAQPTGA